MKNKKLFAILTLVCFMFTLMPVAAFAADTATVTLNNGSVVINISDDDAINSGDVLVKIGNEVATGASIEVDGAKAKVTFPASVVGKWAAAELSVVVDNVEVAATDIEQSYIDLAKAYAAGTAVYNPKSNIATVKPSLELDKNEFGKAIVTLKNSADVPQSNVSVYVWAEAVANEVSAAFVASGKNVTTDSYCVPGVYKVTVPAENAVSGSETFDIAFTTAGTYTLKATAATQPDFSDVAKLKQITSQNGYNTIKVNSAAVDSKQFVMDVTTLDSKGDIAETIATDLANGETTVNDIDVVADGVSKTDVVIGFTYGSLGPVMPGQEVSISTNSSSIDVNVAKAYTNWRGEVEFAVSGTIEGDYLITVKTGNYSADIKVTVGSTAAAEIELIDEPTAPIALDIATDDFEGEVTFEITDVNGNLVKDAAKGVTNAGDTTPDADSAKYVSFIEKPEGSKLADKNIWIENAGEEWNLVLNKAFDKEGTYSVKVVLDNGRSAVATWEVKEFQTPVEIVIDAPATVELGTSFDVELDYVDVNGVTKPADNKTDLAATGYAIYDFGKVVDDVYNVDVKTDEKYEGSVITLTAVSQKYALVSTATVTVAAEAVAIEFEDANVETNVNNKIEWNVVDAEGNAVQLDNVDDAVIKYVVLDKPEDAKVSVVDRTGANFDGDGEMSLTSNKVGNVAVQAIAKLQNPATGVVKYYTGSDIIAVGTAGVGDVVVMSIGSNEIVINDAKGTIDAAPIVENNRTFVPFRALAEAFGATVAFDEATQAVTADLNGTTVVMTIGSAEYTVNGEAATADVAPFINGSRTMVPVRFAAEAFGIKVIPTYDENGATADILFNL